MSNSFLFVRNFGVKKSLPLLAMDEEEPPLPSSMAFLSKYWRTFSMSDVKEAHAASLDKHFEG
jgi:hypothetical protein